jgi:hypothetical protein
MLLDSSSLARPFWNGKHLSGMVESHLRGDRNYTNEIHLALTLELIHRTFIDGSYMPSSPAAKLEKALV